MSSLTLDSPIEVIVVSGVEGPSLYVHERRVSGPKPWGGGSTLHTFFTTPRQLLEAITGLASPDMSDFGKDYDVAEWHSTYRARQAPLLIERLAALPSEPWTGRLRR